MPILTDRGLTIAGTELCVCVRTQVVMTGVEAGVEVGVGVGVEVSTKTKRKYDIATNHSAY